MQCSNFRQGLTDEKLYEVGSGLFAQVQDCVHSALLLLEARPRQVKEKHRGGSY
jgi:hypothetical protein